jgi:hypothetical protein
MKFLSGRSVVIRLSMAVVATASHYSVQDCAGGDIVPAGRIKFSNLSANDISDVAFSKDRRHAFVVSDETNGIIVLKRGTDAAEFAHLTTVAITGESSSDAEADLEAVEIEGEWLYAVGSHSAKRKEAKPGNSRNENRERLLSVSSEKPRRILIRCKVADLLDGDPDIKRSDLWDRIRADETLALFKDIPGKENGVDIEALVIDGERILAGFRSPILRGGYALVMDTKFAASSAATLRYLKLGGDGVRDACKIEAGQYLLLTGPSGELPRPYSFSLWNGLDVIEGEDGPGEGELTELGSLKLPAEFDDLKPEGVALFNREGSRVEVVVTFDGIDGGSPIRCEINLP